MELRYSAAAAASGALMASAAGFDSVPADMGCLFAQRAFAPPAVPSSVEAVISLSAPKGTSIHYATWWVGLGGWLAWHVLRGGGGGAGMSWGGGGLHKLVAGTNVGR